jgi:GNAT superfamily N-acetyltransferase
VRKSIDPSEVEAYPLTQSFDISNFECGRESYDKYLKQTASDDHNSDIGKVWLFIHHKKIAGYVTIAMSQLHKSEHKRLSKLTTHGYIPGMLLGQMARDKNYKGRGIGKIMISWVVREAINISKRIGCRLIILQSEEDKVKTYENYGFLRIPDSKRKKNMMFFDLSWYSESKPTVSNT